ncbi:acetyl-/propionyl-coenzyme A carboxylase alpha chain [mine drainage metagenome]|uniref:Acetyl-/propionyl-coenzyme A carboxylase alpha chain n=1 Tax=mine drainage metagenome TaxID=410659 RepID=A0A1J5QRW9_9ZZZZ
MFNKVLIANRGEIACRIMRTLKRMGVASVAVYSEVDANARHVLEADQAVCVGPAPAAESYLNVERILAAAKATGAQAIHPGYGFLSENPAFAESCETAGIAFIGPTPQQMRDFGLKHTARELAESCGLPLLPGTGLLADAMHAKAEAARIGYPVMLKSTAGGGGIGMQLIWSEDQLTEAFESVQRLSRANFKEGGIYLEKYVQAARHIEVQIFGDGKGEVISLGERDCSVQRRNQKVIEETPAPNISDRVRSRLWQAAEKLGRALGYRSAGTVEFVYDNDSGEFYFLEVNTRLQVEHGVTELVCGLDLVEWMVRLAANELLPLAQYIHQPQGHAIQVRLYAEDPNKNFQPCSGVLTEVKFPDGARIDAWVEKGSEVSPFYDPLLAKVLVHATDRDAAVEKLRDVLARTRLAGIETNLEYLRQVLADSVFPAGRQVTRYLNGFHYRPASIDVLEPGVQSTVQDYPGRLGYWAVGVPPSGPMDHLAFRLANRLAGNDEGAAALELTLVGPTLRFNCDAVIALAGAPMVAELDGTPLGVWQSHAVRAGSVLRLGSIQGAGCRTYLAVQGGFDVPDYLGSKSTFTLGQFGGHGGRTLRVGDVVHLVRGEPADLSQKTLAAALVPGYSRAWEIGVLYGPHGAPDFFTDADINMFFATDWEVHYNSNRTGVRLIGPKPEWARKDGGEAGLHPSNIHDNAYAIGTVDFTGDMPVILGPDGPSLGGFVCPATIVQAELWKMGQLKPGDTVRFKRMTQDEACRAEEIMDRQVETLQIRSAGRTSLPTSSTSPLLDRIPANGTQLAVAYRQAGDKNLLVEYGPLVLDLNLRFRVHALMQWLEKQAIPGILDLTPGIRSLQLHYDSRRLPVDRLLDILSKAERELPAIEHMEVPTRIVHLPLSWDDAATQLAIEKYMQSVRKDAPWCPSNIEFIRRINGLGSIDEVKDIVFNASYLTLGLGDVYLGAPVATPVDPRHRLVTTKYNPARTWTPENAVGIGGAYMCVYGMEGPGGYQFVGRTIQMWNRWRQTADFKDGKPWLLRFFDQIRFYPVTPQELLQMREDFPRGKFRLKVEEQTFRLKDYNAFLTKNAGAINAFKTSQQAAFEAERERWIATGQAHYSSDLDVADAAADSELDLPPNSRAVASHVAGNLWQVKAAVGDIVRRGDTVVIVESMKMEISVTAPADGTITHVFCHEGGQVAAGQDLFIIEMEN